MPQDETWNLDPARGPGWELNQYGSRRWVHSSGWVILIYGDHAFPVSHNNTDVHTANWESSLSYDPETGEWDIETEAPYEGNVSCSVPRAVFKEYERITGMV